MKNQNEMYEDDMELVEVSSYEDIENEDVDGDGDIDEVYSNVSKSVVSHGNGKSLHNISRNSKTAAGTKLSYKADGAKEVHRIGLEERIKMAQARAEVHNKKMQDIEKKQRKIHPER